MTFRDSSTPDLTVVSLDYRYSVWPVPTSPASYCSYHTMEIPDSWVQQFQWNASRWIDDLLGTPRVVLTVGIEGDLTSGTVLVDKRLFVQHPDVVLPALGLSHGDVAEYSRNQPQLDSTTQNVPERAVYVTRIRLSEWPRWREFLLPELTRQGSGAIDLPVFSDQIIQHIC